MLYPQIRWARSSIPHILLHLCHRIWCRGAYRTKLPQSLFKKKQWQMHVLKIWIYLKKLIIVLFLPRTMVKLQIHPVVSWRSAFGDLRGYVSHYGDVSAKFWRSHSPWKAIIVMVFLRKICTISRMHDLFPIWGEGIDLFLTPGSVLIRRCWYVKWNHRV